MTFTHKFLSFFGLFLFPVLLSGQATELAPTSNVKVDTPFISENIHNVLKEINKVKKDILLNNNHSAILTLQEVLDRLKTEREEAISAFFPNTFADFALARADKNNFFTTTASDFGVLFSKTYRSEDGKTIDINVVYEDASIAEYIKTIQDQKRLKNFENAEVITLKERYKALQKISLDDGFIERNVAIHSTLLVNVIGSGFTDTIAMDALIEEVDFEGLSLYLK